MSEPEEAGSRGQNEGTGGSGKLGQNGEPKKAGQTKRLTGQDRRNRGVYYEYGIS